MTLMLLIGGCIGWLEGTTVSSADSWLNYLEICGPLNIGGMGSLLGGSLRVSVGYISGNGGIVPRRRDGQTFGITFDQCLGQRPHLVSRNGTQGPFKMPVALLAPRNLFSQKLDLGEVTIDMGILPRILALLGYCRLLLVL